VIEKSFSSYIKLGHVFSDQLSEDVISFV